GHRGAVFACGEIGAGKTTHSKSLAAEKNAVLIWKTSGFRNLYNAAKVKGQLIYAKDSDETCVAQLAKRRVEKSERARFDNASVFEEVSSYLQGPDGQEGFDIEIIIRG
ncbi:MAG: hypothetical protein CMP84_00745, partial [Gammaproteobacteria bacterium]|nr:hypothetical protein [Gammaproteobacteria bacterium]